MSYKPTVAVDFDGVLHKYSKGYHDGTIYDVPVPGAKQALKKLSETYDIVIFTCRTDIIGISRYISKHFDLKGFTVTNRKPKAKIYIDDRGIRFTSWKKTMRLVEKYGDYEPENVMHAEEENW